jgi:XTP/dITP diphosphohydrolase
LNKLIIGSRNRGKIEEIKQILSIEEVEYLDLDTLEFAEPIEESGTTFSENAIVKAVTIFKKYKIPVVTDDSGLSVPYLRGSPGIYSARFAGPDATDDENNALLLQMLEGVPAGLRIAQFQCASCFFYDIDTYVIEEGSIGGFITFEPAGENGFGYDPVFYLPEYKKTMAQLTDKEKNSISHRALSFRKLKPYIESYFEKGSSLG